MLWECRASFRCRNLNPLSTVKDQLAGGWPVAPLQCRGKWRQCHVSVDLGAVLPAESTGLRISDDPKLVSGFAHHHITLTMNGEVMPMRLRTRRLFARSR